MRLWQERIKGATAQSKLPRPLSKSIRRVPSFNGPVMT